jgi:hypothetical protein
MIVLTVKWTPKEETQIFGTFKSLQLARSYFEVMLISHDDREPVEALIAEPQDCPGRRKMEILKRRVEGRWG